MCLLAAMVWKLDESVGRVMKALSDRGVLDSAIVVFTSDNGAPTTGIHRNHGSNWPLRGVRKPFSRSSQLLSSALGPVLRV
jgi:arylsulfatase A-like enzyme